ncbi:MAG TPA: hypothetical protein VL495_02365 [Edaphobacter sp.]|jgi:hypothetical protein|nr:hypothetical protein [Edaphobacter sp.]
MRLFTKFENWSLIVLFASLAVAYALCFAPGRSMFGDLSDPLSTTIEGIMIFAVLVEMVVLFTMSRRREH